MASTAADVLNLLLTAPARIDEALRSPRARSRRAGSVALALRALWPSSALYACLLWEDSGPRSCVVDGSGTAREDWALAFRDALSAAESATGPLPSAVRLLGHPLVLAEIPSPAGRFASVSGPDKKVVLRWFSCCNSENPLIDSSPNCR